MELQREDEAMLWEKLYYHYDGDDMDQVKWLKRVQAKVKIEEKKPVMVSMVENEGPTRTDADEIMATVIQAMTGRRVRIGTWDASGYENEAVASVEIER